LRSFSGDGHHLIIAQPVAELRLQPLRKRQLLARRQLAHSSLDFSRPAHGETVNRGASTGKREGPGERQL
jgi:hypothetical protein